MDTDEILKILKKLFILSGGVGNFGQVGVYKSLAADELYGYKFDVPEGKVMFLTAVKFGNINAGKLTIRYEGYNVESKRVTIEQPMINFQTFFKRWIGLKENSGGLTIKNLDTSTQLFDATFDYILIDEAESVNNNLIE